MNNKKNGLNPKNEIYDTLICKNCWRSFTITRGEYEYITNKGWDLPKRCKGCRRMRRSDNLLEQFVMASNEEAHRFFKKQLRGFVYELKRRWL